MPHVPKVSQEPSEMGTLLKVRYPERTDKFSMKFGRGHRTFNLVQGRRPLTRTAKRAQRPL